MAFLSESFLWIYAGHIAFWLNTLLWKVFVCNTLQSEHSCITSAALDLFQLKKPKQTLSPFFFQRA